MLLAVQVIDTQPLAVIDLKLFTGELDRELVGNVPDIRPTAAAAALSASATAAGTPTAAATTRTAAAAVGPTAATAALPRLLPHLFHGRLHLLLRIVTPLDISFPNTREPDVLSWLSWQTNQPNKKQDVNHGKPSIIRFLNAEC